MWSSKEFLQYWFGPDLGEGIPTEQAQRRWFVADRKYDRELRRRFLTSVVMASEGALDHWLDEPEGYVAVVLLLDQVSRHIYRGTSLTYDNDKAARRYVRKGLDDGNEKGMSVAQKIFFYLPLTHSEILQDQKESVRLHEALYEMSQGAEKDFVSPYMQDARSRYEIIKRFGRFPHRNKVLKRASRPEEDAFLGESQHTFNA
ncbi:hypothetical protein BTA51_21725 [Hahella sp. CCB-MM4]|uniref:DUF924 family protein n=1 Tax=Hahella sp. (strain CCB-MM4) TaxID=1926491 RepID=UPI000B9B6D28|nr:DUF924 family protein [Hahella sp. CCB-MM4]OZG71269.1 hypothetical protein BTA51_21725 [Hahella sp. CCB-MM4]